MTSKTTSEVKVIEVKMLALVGRTINIICFFDVYSMVLVLFYELSLFPFLSDLNDLKNDRRGQSHKNKNIDLSW